MLCKKNRRCGYYPPALSFKITIQNTTQNFKHKKRAGLSCSQRVEKVFRHAVRLLRKVLNFVFLRTLLYDGTACEQKTKNAKIAANIELAAIFFELYCLKNFFGIGLPIHTLNVLQNNFGVFQGLYRQSKSRVILL